MSAAAWSQTCCCFRGWCLALLFPCCTSALAQTAVEPPAEERKAALVERLLHPKPSPWTPDLRQLLRLMAEAPVRGHFRGLSADRVWGPAHPQWRRHFRDFREDYLGFLAPEARRAEAELSARLIRTLSEEELSELVAVVDDPELDQLLQQASRVGLDLDVAVRTQSLAATPDLYTAEEIAAIRVALAKLQAKDATLTGYLAAKMQALGARFGGPAFVRYQRMVIDSLDPVATASVDDDAFRARFDAWRSDWRRRVGF